MKTQYTDLSAAIRPSRALLTLVCLALLAASLFGISPVVTAQGKTDSASFATPEEAIAFYVEAVAQSDITQVLQVCAVDEMSENFRFDLYTDRIRALTVYAPAPSDYPFYVELNRAQFLSQILNQVKNLTYGLLATENGMIEGRTVPIDAAGAAQFLEEVNPERLANLQLVEVGVPNPEMAQNENTQRIWQAQAQIYGADELTERVALLLFDEEYYYVGFTLLRYGEDWQISGANSALANTSALGAPSATTVEEFQAMIGSD
jgi:hypothetical protein